MLSRSSSAYQPLEKAAATSGTGVGAAEDEVDIDLEAGGTSHEMTSIAVISNHPFRSNNGSGGDRAAVNTRAVPSGVTQNLDFSLCSEEKTQWTNFHFVMCIGIVGFFVFWITLLSKMYLPEDFHFWSFGSSDDNDHGNSTTTALPVMDAEDAAAASWPPPE